MGRCTRQNREMEVGQTLRCACFSSLNNWHTIAMGLTIPACTSSSLDNATFSTSSLHNNTVAPCYDMPSILYHPCPCLFCPSPLRIPASQTTALPHCTARLRISSSSSRTRPRHIAVSHDMWLSVWHPSLAVAAALPLLEPSPDACNS